MSFLEALDVLNEHLIRNHEKYPEGPVAFDHDCREGICGACSLVIDGVPHGPRQATTTCQLHMREFAQRGFKDGDTITVEGKPVLLESIDARNPVIRINSTDIR